MKTERKQMILPRAVGEAALRRIIADCELADAKLSVDRRKLRKFLKEARRALKETMAAKGRAITYQQRGRK